MNKNVIKAIIYLLKEEEKVLSWGMTNISIKGSSIHFDVDGFIYQGHIIIKCDEMYYEIQLEDGKKIRCLDVELTDILDSNIERTENYQQDLEKWLSSFN